MKRDTVEMPDEAKIPDFYMVSIPDVAMSAAITTDGEILLKSDYWYVIGSDVIECLAGMFE